MAGSASRREVVSVVECWAEEVADARITSTQETLSIIESITLEFIRQVASGNDPTLQLVRTRPITLFIVTQIYNTDFQIREKRGERWKRPHTPRQGQDHKMSVWEEGCGCREIC